jgi:hypothetical protein
MTSATDVKYIRITDFDDNGIPEGHEFVTAEVVESRYALQVGDILFARSGATVGKTYLYTGDIGAAIFAGYCIRFRFNSDLVLPEFVYAYTKTSRYQTWVKSIQRPSGQPNINKEEFKAFTIPLPPLDIQHTLIAEMEAARESRRAKLIEADSLLTSIDGWLLAQLGLEPPPADERKVFAVRLGSIRKRFDVHANHPRFVKLFQNLKSHKFSIVPLKALALDIFSGTTPLSGGDAYTDATQGIPFVRSGEITRDGLVADAQEVFLKPEVHNGAMKRSQLKENDLLIAIVGATIGAVGVYNHFYPANINQAIAAIRLDTKRILPSFVRWYLSTSIGQAILDFLKRPVARANINLEEIGEIPVLIPPFEIQQNIIDQVEKKRAEAHRLRVEAEAEWQAAKRRFEEQLLTGREA